eukprot:1906952-Pyramimonas_sp.AAC.1
MLFNRRRRTSSELMTHLGHMQNAWTKQMHGQLFWRNKILAGSPAASVSTSVGPGGSSGGGVCAGPRYQQDRPSQFTPTYLELKGWVTDWSNQ